MSFSNILSISLAAIFAENIVFTQLLGITPFMKDSGNVKSAVKTGMSVTIAMFIFAILSRIADRLLIAPLELEYMRTVIFVLVISGGLCAGEIILKKKFPSFSEKTGISSSYVAVNTAILGIMLITTNSTRGFFDSVIYAFASGVGFTMAITLFAAVRERVRYSEIPKAFEGIPIALITAGLIALAFGGFQGMKFM